MASGYMQHQNLFALPPNLGRQGLLQITTPTEEESRAAAATLNEAFDRLGSPLAEPCWPESWGFIDVLHPRLWLRQENAFFQLLFRSR
jgi:hypothetical protein